VTGDVTAGQSAGAFALSSITGNVYADRDGIASTLDSSLGSVTAGRDALAVAGDAASGPVAGGRHAGVLAFGTVSSSVTAASGDAFVVTWGAVDNTVSAGESAFVAAGDGGTVTMNAPNDAVLVSFGAVTASLNAGRDAFAWSAGNLLGNLQAARDGTAISLAANTMGLETGRYAYAWAFDEYHSNIFSGRDALVVSLGDVNAGVFASGSGLIYAVEDVIGSVDAGQYAGVVTWGDAAGPMTVKGPEGAFGWAYGDFNGFVESTDGNAFLTACGNGSGAARAGLYAEAYTVGDWVGDIEAGDVGIGVALGNFNGNVMAASDGYILSESNVDAGMTVGRDVYVWAIGDVDGNYSAGRDATVITYADYDADLYAARDVGRREYNGYALPGVWARGNITGTIEAGRNIGNDQHTGAYTEWDYGVFSYGTINATIKAENTVGHADGGHIQSVAAWGPIAGHIEAGDTIHYIRSGDAVTATLIAPNLLTLIEFDSTITTDHPYPDTPASVIDQVMAAVADDWALVLATKTQVSNDIAQLFVDFAADKALEAAALADVIAQVSASVANAITEAADALAADIAAGNAELDVAEDAAALELVGFETLVATSQSAVQDRRNQVRQDRQASYDQATTLAAQTQAAMVDADAEIVVLKNEILDLSSQERTQYELDWQQKADELVETTLVNQSPYAASDLVLSASDSHRDVLGPMLGTLPTSLIAIANAGVDAVVNTATFGARDYLHVFGHQDDPYYNSAYIPARISFELLITLGAGKAAKVSKVGKIIRAQDVISSGVTAGRGVYGMTQEGPTVWNCLEVGMGAFGIGYNGRGFVDDVREFLPSRAPNRGVVDGPFDPRGTAGAAKAWTSIRGRLKAAQLPTSGRIRYVPPKNYNPASPLPRGPNNGFIDRFGNEWVRGPSRTAGEAFEWDVQLSQTGKEMLGWLSREGAHVNVSLGGHVTH